MSIVIRPVPVTPDMLISSSIPENDKPAWDVEGEYAVGDQVTYMRQCYESVQAPNVGNIPTSDPLHWALIGASNRWRMFDALGEVKSVAPSPLVVKLIPGTRIDSIALRGLRATSVNIEIREGDGGPLIYEIDKPLGRTGIASWSQYFFEPFSLLDAATFTQIPSLRQACITITITGDASVAIGDLVIGRASSIGRAEYGAQAGIVSYGRKDRTATGGSRLIRGRFARRNSLHTLVESKDKDRVFKTLADLRETPCLFQGTTALGHELLTLFGTYEDFSVDIAYVTASYLSIELLGFAEKIEPEGI